MNQTATEIYNQKPGASSKMPNSPMKLSIIECRYCQKSFSKGEHLRRHERSHTGARPYRCKECQRPFARQDSLARHEKLHTRTKDGSVPSQYPSPPSSLISKQSKIETAASPLEGEDFGAGMIPENDTTNQPMLADQASVSGSGSGISTMGEDSPLSAQSLMQNFPPTAELDFDLMWPDAEDLFETLLATEATNQWQMPLMALPIASGSLYPSNNMFEQQGAFGDKASPSSPIPSGESHRAVHNVSEMVSSLSSSVTAAVEATSLSSVFLDECLHMFFVRFIPTFPVLHRATFVFRECTQPLLLNAMAIGSLYLGPKSSVAKGEALWRLAHIAVTTSWEVLITHSGPYDACQGVQLVVTALLAQVYGALSKNRAIRNTSQAFHALSFFWARQCALSSNTISNAAHPSTLPPLNAPASEKNNAWRVWAAKEIQQRALLGHYLVDGLISRMSGEIPSVRHAANQLCLPSTEAAFEARTADDWLITMHAQSSPRQQPSFRKIISSLFLPIPPMQPLIHPSCSAFSLRVVLEGLQSLVPDCSTSENDDYDSLLGVPTKSSLRRALAQIHTSISRALISEPERLELFLRWHTICLDLCKDSSLLCRAVCSRYNITQHVCAGPPHQMTFQQKADLDLVSWAQMEDARRALLHAVAIQEIVEQLPRGRAHVIHIPSSLFASATTYCVFSLAGQTTVNLPEIVDWQSVLREGYEGLAVGEDNTRAGTTETKRYLRGENLGTEKRGEKRNLLYELNSMQKLFRCLCSQWGIAYDMEEVIDQWISLCH